MVRSAPKYSGQVQKESPSLLNGLQHSCCQGVSGPGALTELLLVVFRTEAHLCWAHLHLVQQKPARAKCSGSAVAQYTACFEKCVGADGIALSQAGSAGGDPLLILLRDNARQGSILAKVKLGCLQTHDSQMTLSCSQEVQHGSW